MQKVFILLLSLLFPIFINCQLSINNISITEQEYHTIFANNPKLKKEILHQHPMFAFAILGKTKPLSLFLDQDVFPIHPVSRRNILHYLAMANQHQTLKQVLKYPFVKKYIYDCDITELTPLNYAKMNESTECMNIIKSIESLRQTQFYDQISYTPNNYIQQTYNIPPPPEYFFYSPLKKKTNQNPIVIEFHGTTENIYRPDHPETIYFDPITKKMIPPESKKILRLKKNKKVKSIKSKKKF